MKRYSLCSSGGILSGNLQERPLGMWASYEEAAAVIAEKDKEIARLGAGWDDAIHINKDLQEQLRASNEALKDMTLARNSSLESVKAGSDRLIAAEARIKQQGTALCAAEGCLLVYMHHSHPVAQLVGNSINQTDNLSALEAHDKEVKAKCLEEIATMCDELETHYCTEKDVALLNGEMELSNAMSGEPRAARFIATELRRLTGEIK